MYNELTRGIVAEIEALRQECEALRKDAERYRWLRDLLAVEDVCRLVDEHAQWDWCQTDPAESAKTDAAVDKAMAVRRVLALHNVGHQETAANASSLSASLPSHTRRSAS